MLVVRTLRIILFEELGETAHSRSPLFTRMVGLPAWVSWEVTGFFHLVASLLAVCCGFWLLSTRRRSENDGEAIYAVILG